MLLKVHTEWVVTNATIVILNRPPKLLVKVKLLLLKFFKLNIMQKLQEAMDEEADYHDPPPPPPHLMALTQGFKVRTCTCYTYIIHTYNIMYVYGLLLLWYMA